MIHKFPYMKYLTQIINNYESFKYIASELPYAPINSTFRSYYPDTSPLLLQTLKVSFPSEYVYSTFDQALVRTFLSEMAYDNKLNPDFWNMSNTERLNELTRYSDLYSEYIIFDRLSLKQTTMEKVINTIDTTAKDNHQPFPAADAEKILMQFLNFDTIEIGGYDFSPDYTWLAVKEDTILLIHCSVPG